MAKFYVPNDILKDNAYVNGTNRCLYFTSINSRPVQVINTRYNGQTCSFYVYTDDQYVFRKTCDVSSYVYSCTNGWSNFDTTSNVYYRKDIDSILVIFFIVLLVAFYFPYRIISRMFGRWLKW